MLRWLWLAVAVILLDQFTKWVEAYALPDQGAESTAKTLVYEFITRYGAPPPLLFTRTKGGTSRVTCSARSALSARSQR